MSNTQSPARINVRLIVTIVLVTGVLGVGAVAARKIRSKIIAENALARGKAAFEKGDWEEAGKELREFLSRRPDHPDILLQYAHALRRQQPVESGDIAGAIDAYRRVLRLPPGEANLHDTAYEELARLYRAIGNREELAYIADQRLRKKPNDPQATLWKAEAQIMRRDLDEAQNELQSLVSRLEETAAEHSEYAEACGLLAMLEVNEAGVILVDAALKRLDRGIDKGPPSARLLVSRAGLHRQRAAEAAKTGNVIDQAASLSAMRADLERASAMESIKPKTRLQLGAEWLGLGELDSAAAEFDKADAVDLEAVYAEFIDADDWEGVKFQHRAELVMRSRDREGAAALADKVLNPDPDNPDPPILDQKRHRYLALPIGVRLYVFADTPKAAELADYCLVEYEDLSPLFRTAAQPAGPQTLLHAYVAWAKRQPYNVLKLLEPLAVTNLPDRTRAQLWQMLADAYRVTEQTRREVQATLEYLGIQGNDPAAIRQLIQAHIRLRDWGSAWNAATRMKAGEFFELRILQMQATLFYASTAGSHDLERDLLKMEQDLSELRKSRPRDVQVRQMQTGLAVYRNQLDEAERGLRLAIEECDKPLPAETQLARLYLSQGKNAQAVETCRAACDRYPDEAEPWEALERALIADGKTDEARQALKTGLERVSEATAHRRLRIRLARLELLNGETETGMAHLRDMAEKDASDVGVRLMLLGLRPVREAPDGAAQKLVDEIREIEGDLGVQWRFQQASLWLGSPSWRSEQAKAVEQLEYCLNVDPKWAGAAVLLGALHERTDRPEQAEATYRRVLSVNPGAMAVTDKLLNLLARQDRIADAKETLEQVEGDPRRLQSRRVQFAIRSGEFDDAIRELELRLAGDPNDGASHLLLARLVHRDGKPDAAERALQHLDAAEGLLEGSLAPLAVRVAILRDEDRGDEVRQLLDRLVEDSDTVEARLLRASIHTLNNELEAAEADYLKVAEMHANASGFVVLGQFFGQTQRPDDAIAAWERGLEKYEADADLERLLVRSLLLRNAGDDQSRARELLDKLTSRLRFGEKDPDLMMAQAGLELQRKNNPAAQIRAQALLEEVIELQPGYLGAHMSLIALALERRDYESMRKRAIQALAAIPKNPRLMMARATAERQLNNPAMALRISKMVLADYPENRDARDLLVALALVQSADPGTIRDALEVVDRALERMPELEELQISRASLLAGSGRAVEAVESLERFERQHTDTCTASTPLALAGLHILQGDQEMAVAAFRRAFESTTVNHAAFAERLKSLARRGLQSANEIIALADAYVAAFPDKVEVPAVAAAALSTVSSLTVGEEARKLLKKAHEWMMHVCRVDPDQPESKILLARLTYMIGDTSLAKELYRQALTLDPDNAAALNDLAWCMYETAASTADYEAALQLADRGIQKLPDEPHLRDTRGEILAKLPGRLVDARADFEKRLELVAQNERERAQTLLRLAEICLDLDDSDAARRHLSDAIRVDRRLDGAFSSSQRDRLATLQQRLRKAETGGG